MHEMSTTDADRPADGSSPRLNFGPKPTIGVGAARKAVADDIPALVKAHVELAKAELASGAKDKAAGAGAFAVAGAMGWLALQGLLITAGFALALVVPAWAAALIVSVVLLLIAGGAALVGKRKMSTPVSLDVTKAKVEEAVAWTKSQITNR
jgi:hypothetical protein